MICFAGDAQWLREQWQHARLLGPNALLAIDEIQKIPNWPETVKALWDAEAHRAPEERLRVVLLGSSAVQIQDGVTESLAGRFELTRLGHWRFCELQAAFGYDHLAGASPVVQGGVSQPYWGVR